MYNRFWFFDGNGKLRGGDTALCTLPEHIDQLQKCVENNGGTYWVLIRVNGSFMVTDVYYDYHGGTPSEREALMNAISEKYSKWR